MNDIPAGFVATEVPARLADLEARFVRPHDWVVPELPPEQPDFEPPQAFAALAIAMASYAAIVFSAGARPAYGDGTLADWLLFLAREQGYDPGPIEHETLLSLPAVGCWAMQQSDGVLMRMRLVLFEDGGRLVQVAAMAPQALWASVHDTLRTMLASFALARPRGGSVALAPVGQELPETTFGVGKIVVPPPAPVVRQPEEPVVEYAEIEPVPQPDESEPPPTEDVGGVDAADDLPVQSFDTGLPASFASVARAADVATLLQDHELNQRLLQSGAGFAAPIAVDHGPDARCAEVKAAALQAVVCVPYGWHVLDDTRRTLVHDGDGGVQIAMSRRARGGLDEHAFLLAKWRELRQEAPGLQARRVCCNGNEMLLLRDLPIDGTLLSQAWFVRKAPANQFLVLRCTSTVAEHERTLNTAELLLLHTQFLDAASEGPTWWVEALRLERVGDLAAAERCITKAVDHLGAFSQVAHLYELRGKRLAAFGDAAGAAAAYTKSGEWMDTMAGCATSGGEGAALSYERDQHRARLRLPPYPTG